MPDSRSLPQKIQACKERLERDLSCIRVTRAFTGQDEHAPFLSSRTDGGRQLRPYYLVYFLLVDLLEFPSLGQGEKVAWSVPLEYNSRLYVVEHRKFGLGIFEPQHDPTKGTNSPVTEVGERDSVEICQLINRAIDNATPYFEWRAQQEAAGSRLNVVNNSQALSERYDYFATEARSLRALSEQHHAKGKYSEYSETKKRANWSAQSAIEAFFAWTEHALIHLAILQSKITTGEQVRQLATADWKTKFKAVFDLSDRVTKVHYDLLIDLRKQMRNFLAHGSFGKRGEAFHFHSGVGAVPLLITERDDHPFQMEGLEPFAEFNALASLDQFASWLWSGCLAPAKRYLDCGMPTILTDAANGAYVSTMSSDSDMEQFVYWQAMQWDRAANMDF